MKSIFEDIQGGNSYCFTLREPAIPLYLRENRRFASRTIAIIRHDRRHYRCLHRGRAEKVFANFADAHLPGSRVVEALFIRCKRHLVILRNLKAPFVSRNGGIIMPHRSIHRKRRLIALFNGGNAPLGIYQGPCLRALLCRSRDGIYLPSHPTYCIRLLLPGISLVLPPCATRKSTAPTVPIMRLTAISCKSIRLPVFFTVCVLITGTSAKYLILSLSISYTDIFA